MEPSFRTHAPPTGKMVYKQHGACRPHSRRSTARHPRCPVGGGVVVSDTLIVAPLDDNPPRPAPATDALRRLLTHSSVVIFGQFHLKNQQLALKKFSSSRKKNVVLLCSAQSSTVWTLGASRRASGCPRRVIFSNSGKTRHFCNGIKLAGCG